MVRLKWLIVAPRHENLDAVSAELSAVAHHHDIVPQPPLIGRVTAMQIAQSLTAIDCDVFLWSTHSDGRNLHLSDGETIDATVFAQLVRQAKAKFCFFNMCLGADFAYHVAYLANCDVIFSPVQIEDNLAALYMAQYAAALARDDDYHAAYAEVGNFAGQYEYVDASDSTTRGRVESAEEIAYLRQQNMQIKASLTTLGITFGLIAVLALYFTMVLSDIQHRQNEIHNEMIELRTEVKDIQRQIDRQSGVFGSTAEARQ